MQMPVNSQQHATVTGVLGFLSKIKKINRKIKMGKMIQV